MQSSSHNADIKMASPQCVFSDVLIDHMYFSKTLVTKIHKNSSSPEGVLWWFNWLILCWNPLSTISTWKWFLSVLYNYDSRHIFSPEYVLKYFSELFVYMSHANDFLPVYILWYFNSRSDLTIIVHSITQGSSSPQ